MQLRENKDVLGFSNTFVLIKKAQVNNDLLQHHHLQTNNGLIFDDGK